MRERYNPAMEKMEARDTADAFNKEMEAYWTRPDEKKFVEEEIYPELEVARDLKNKKEVMANFKENEDLGLGRSAEFLIMQGAYQSKWLNTGEQDKDAPQVFLSRTAEFDDVFNGTDMVISLRTSKESPWRYLGIDVTVTDDYDRRDDKLRKTHASLYGPKPRLAKIKYYAPDSGDKDDKPGVIKLSKVLVWLDKTMIFKTIDSYLNSGKSKKAKHPTIDLEGHPAQAEVVREINDQLINQLGIVIRAVKKNNFNEVSPQAVLAEAEECLSLTDDSDVKEVLESQMDILRYTLNLAK